jgi:hypothetical protein
VRYWEQCVEKQGRGLSSERSLSGLWRGEQSAVVPRGRSGASAESLAPEWVPQNHQEAFDGWSGAIRLASANKMALHGGAGWTSFSLVFLSLYYHTVIADRELILDCLDIGNHFDRKAFGL